MMCDIVIAADDALFGQPEIKLGIGLARQTREHRSRFADRSRQTLRAARARNGRSQRRHGRVSGTPSGRIPEPVVAGKTIRRLFLVNLSQ
ncbi:hypothetical protein [Paraburkholderia phymatum]|uniref:hypothetical protein n=1 Tax=Paraburkholderia phymatum TaxID=148447 RepID=UPI003F7557D7